MRSHTLQTTSKGYVMKRENKHLSMKKLNELQKILLAEKQQIMNKSLSQDDYCLQKDDLSDVLDEASANQQASQTLRFRNRELFYLKKVNQSLEKFDDHSYGMCEECDEPIAYERLRARPTANLCIHCKEESEMIEKNSIFAKKSKSLGKTIAEM